MNEPAVVDIGTQLLRVLSISGLLVAVALTYTGGLQGTGDTRGPLYISIVSQVVVPLGICFVIQQTGTLDPLDIWLAILAGHATRCVLSVIRFRQGKWRGIAVDLDDPLRSTPGVTATAASLVARPVRRFRRDPPPQLHPPRGHSGRSRKMSPAASMPCPKILHPQWSQTGASLWAAHSKLSNVWVCPAAITWNDR